VRIGIGYSTEACSGAVGSAFRRGLQAVHIRNSAKIGRVFG
jgi:hypothetical protein